MFSFLSTADLSSHLFPLTLESFSGLGHEARLRAFSRMLDLCSHHDQAALREELEARLARDFLTLLPPEIAVMILSYLPLKGLITGMHVCRRWRDFISGANLLWRNMANEIGLSEAIVKKYLPECGSYIELTLMALRHRKKVSSYVPNQKVAECFDNHYMRIFPCGRYITCEHLISSTTTVKRMSNDGSLVSLHTFDYSRSVQVDLGHFASVSCSDFVFWGNSETGWIGWSSTDPPSSSHPPPSKMARTEDVSDLARRIETGTGLQVWRTNELEHCRHEHTAVCPNCGLIALFGLHVSSHSGPRVLLRKLTPGESTVDEIGKFALQLPKNDLHNNMDNCSMRIFPKECDQGECGSHHLLIHYEPENLLNWYFVQAELSCISELPMVRVPTELTNWTGDLFADLWFSIDGSVVAFCNTNEEQYHIWEPDGGRVVAVCFPPNLHFQFWLAVGKLYSIVAGDSEGRDVFAVIGTYTGVLLLKDIYDFQLYSPADQSWLSTFDTPEHLPIAIIVAENPISSPKVSQIGSITGRRSV